MYSKVECDSSESIKNVIIIYINRKYTFMNIKSGSKRP